MTTNQHQKTTISLETQQKNLAFNIERSIRYNTKRQHFFENWEKISNFVALVLGSSTAYSITQQNQNAALAISLILTILSSLALVIGFSNKARDHLEFKRRFLALKARLISEPLSQTLCDEIKIAMSELDLEEPPVLIVLEQICYNEQLNREGFPKEKLTKIKWYQRMLANYVDICPHTLFEQNNKKS